MGGGGIDEALNHGAGWGTPGVAQYYPAIEHLEEVWGRIRWRLLLEHTLAETIYVGISTPQGASSRLDAVLGIHERFDSSLAGSSLVGVRGYVMSALPGGFDRGMDIEWAVRHGMSAEVVDEFVVVVSTRCQD